MCQHFQPFVHTIVAHDLCRAWRVWHFSMLSATFPCGLGGLELQNTLEMASRYHGFQRTTYMFRVSGVETNDLDILIRSIWINMIESVSSQSLQRISWWISEEVHD